MSTCSGASAARASTPDGDAAFLLRNRFRADIAAAVAKDPATTSRVAALIHPGLHAVWMQSIAHRLGRAGHPWAARLISYAARVLTGVDAHPAAVIHPGVFIDHGAGVVIGETAVLESDVMLYHQVTLGSAGWWDPQERSGRRHPVIRAGTVLSTGVMVLGPVIVGRNCTIGAGALVLADVPEDTRIRPGSIWRGPGDTEACAATRAALKADTPRAAEPEYVI